MWEPLDAVQPDARSSLFVSARSAKRRSAVRRVVRLAFAAVTVLSLLASVTVGALYAYAGKRFAQHPIDCLADRTAGCGETNAVEPIDGVRNVLVVGNDSRVGLTPSQLEQLGTQQVQGPDRADTIMLVHLSPRRDDAVVVSFPRDLRVDIPGEGRDRINAARALGGPELMVRTVEDYTGIPVHHYVELDLAGFLRLVELIDGVEVCLDEPLVDPAAGADLAAGEHVLRGSDAAAYVRARKSDPRGDLGRIERQQRFIRQALRKVLAPATLVNPLRVKRLIDRAASAVVTDSGFTTSDMLRLTWSFKDLDPGSLTMVTVPSDLGPRYVEARPEEAEALFQAIRVDEPVPAREEVTVVEPGDIRLAILNGVGVDGLAAAAAQQLTDAGVEVVETGNVDDFGRERTVIMYGPGDLPLARFVAGFFPDADLAESDMTGQGNVQVILGTDWAAAPQVARPPPVDEPPTAPVPPAPASTCV